MLRATADKNASESSSDWTVVQTILDAADAYQAAQSRGKAARELHYNRSAHYEHFQAAYVEDALEQTVATLFKATDAASAAGKLKNAILSQIECGPRASKIDHESNATIATPIANDFASDPRKFGEIKRTTLMSMLGSTQSFDLEQRRTIDSICECITEFGKETADFMLAKQHHENSAKLLNQIDGRLKKYATANNLEYNAGNEILAPGKEDLLACPVASHARKTILSQLDLISPADLKGIKSTYPAIAPVIEKVSRQHQQQRHHGQVASQMRPQQGMDR